MLIWLLVLAALALIGAGAVLLLRRLVPPDVTLISLRPERLSAGEQTFRVGLRVDNPNPLPMPLFAMTYRLWIEERDIASGQSSFQRWIPARGEADIEVLVSGDARRLASTLPALALTRQPWDYRIEGTVSVLPRWRLPYRHVGKTDVKGILRLAASLR